MSQFLYNLILVETVTFISSSKYKQKPSLSNQSLKQYNLKDTINLSNPKDK